MRTLTYLLLTCWTCWAGCTASQGSPPLDRQGFDMDPCTSSGAITLADLTPNEVVDFMEFREQGSSTQSVGERCGGALDVEACEDALALLRDPSGWALRPGGGAPSPRVWIAYTRGDEVGAVGLADIGAFLAPIDTVADAVFLAQIVTLGTVQCGQDSVRRTSRGYEVITQTSYTCGGGRDESRVEVLTDGGAVVLERAVLNAGREEICP